MKSIERRFSGVQKRRPEFSSFINFGAAIKDQGFGVEMISRWLGRLVDPADYEKKDKKALLRHLVLLSNPLRTTQKQG